MHPCLPWGLTIVPYERTTSYHTGAALGPGALLRALGKSFPENCQPSRVDRLGTRDLAAPRPMVRATAAAVSQQLDDGLFPVMFGGEHTSTLGPVTALKKRYPRLGVVHLDAHADQRSSYGGTRYSHASVMRRIADDLSLPVLSLGVRALSAAEARFIKVRGIGLLRGEDLSGWRRHLPPLLEALPRTVYLTVDMDFFDPAVVPGVGTPEPGGASREEAEGIIEAVTAAREVAGFDIVELCPPRESKRSVEAAVSTVQIVLAGARRLAGSAD